MKHALPNVQSSPMIANAHFPTRMQCFIFRNWEMIRPSVLADVLGCDEKTVMSLARDMGLPVPPDVNPDWIEKGYITIIRANWHLCTYEQLAALLGWDLERLAYTLREDDFLSVKLGNFKPDIPPVAYEVLNERQREQTKEIRRVILAAREEMPHHPHRAFDFKPVFASVGSYPIQPKAEKERFRNRIVYSYCALYGDTFASRDLIDASFPDELLQGYQSIGVTGIWTQAVLYTLTPYPFDAALSEGYEKRQEGMRYLVAKLAKYGLKLFLYLNEPRSMPLAFFDAHPDIRGHIEGDYACLCVSAEPVRRYLYEASAQLNRAVPGLGGYLTITASENLTNCFSHATAQSCSCPRCKNRMPSDIIADVNRLLYEGAKEANPDMELLAWNWAWNNMEPDMTHHVIEKMPAGITVMAVSEEGVRKNVGGVETSVLDYSISVEGPGAYARDTWAYAHQTGHSAYAKLQLGVTWEISIVPCVPAFEKTWRHLSGIVRGGQDGGAADTADGIMLGWTLGGFPSPTMRLASCFYADHGTVPSLCDIYAQMFPGADSAALKEAFHLLSEAYDAYPFHISSAYMGPQQLGPANLLYPEQTGYHATMTGIPYDDIEGWRGIYPREVYIDQIKKMSDGWHAGTLALEQAARNTSDVHLQALLRWTKTIDCHFRSMYNQCMFVKRREEGIVDGAIAAEEAALAEEMLQLTALDPTIGYESANHYFYHKNHLLEKLVNCDYIIRTY